MEVTARDEFDRRVIHRAQRGHRGSRAVLLRELQDVWYRFAYKLLNDAELAREATQETGLRFLERLPEFRGDSRLQTWSLGITLNICREMRRSKPHLTLTDAGAVAGREVNDPLFDQAEDLAQLDDWLGRLPERQREALTLRYLEACSLRETAEAMGCAVGTVKATVAQALRSMRRYAGMDQR